MKICDIVQFHSPLSGGVKRYVNDKSRFLAAHPGMRHVVVIPGAGNSVCDEGPLRTYTIRSPRVPGSKSYRFLVSARTIDAVIGRERPDLVEVGDPYAAAWAAVRAAARRDIPIVAFYHSDYPRALQRTLCRYTGATAAAALAWPIRRYLAALYGHMDATLVATNRMLRILSDLPVKRIELTPLGTDTDAFTIREGRADVRRRLGVEPGVPLLLYAGRLAREKNIGALLDMMEQPCAIRGGWRLVVAGDGEHGERVRRRSRAHPRIVWHPYCTATDALADLYSAADLLVHPGTCETFGLTSIEAQACGTRVIGVRGGGLEETLEGERPLVLADAAAPAALAGAVAEALALGEDGAARRRRRERILARFSNRQTFARQVALYARLVADRAAAAPNGKDLSPHAERVCHSPL